MTTETKPVAQKNEVAKAFNSTEQKMMSLFITGVENSLQRIGLSLDDYQINCARSCFKKIHEVCIANKIDINTVKDDVSSFIERAAMLKLNALAMPRECYVMARDVNKSGKTPYLEFGIEGDGNDRMLREYGTGVKKVHRYWEVRENDGFTYPSYNGLDVTPPTWTPKDCTSKVIRVVYPIEYDDGTVHYHISEREGVKKNLLAHINQNLMGEYFGISTYKKEGDALTKAKDELAKKRKAVIDGVKDKTLEEILEDESVQKFMSPSWKSPHSRESMIVRKMRNNITKPIPKDLKNAYVLEALDKSIEPDERVADDRIDKNGAMDVEYEIKENANKEEFVPVPQQAKEAPQEKPQPKPVEEPKTPKVVEKSVETINVNDEGQPNWNL